MESELRGSVSFDFINIILHRLLRKMFPHSIKVEHRLLLWDFREVGTNRLIDENGFSLETNWSSYLASFNCTITKLKEIPTNPKEPYR